MISLPERSRSIRLGLQCFPATCVAFAILLLSACAPVTVPQRGRADPRRGD
jgi:hypothetical protein